MSFDSYQPYPSYGGYPPTLTHFDPYQGASSFYPQQQSFGAGSYPGASPFGAYPINNGLYGSSGQQVPYYPSNPTSPYQPTSFPTNSYNPSYDSYPSGGYNGYNPSSPGSYQPSLSAVTAQNSYRPSGIIPDPFGSVAPVLGTPSYSNGPSYNNPSTSSQQNAYKPIAIIESSPYKPSSSSNNYQQEGYDSITVTAQGSYDKPTSSYKPSSGYRPNVSQSQYKPTSTNYQSYRPTVTGSIQEIPNGYYPSNSQNRPNFYKASSDQVSFPREE